MSTAVLSGALNAEQARSIALNIGEELGNQKKVDSKNEVGDLILPIAAIRGEGTSNDYFPSEVPALPSFALQKAIKGDTERVVFNGD